MPRALCAISVLALALAVPCSGSLLPMPSQDVDLMQFVLWTRRNPELGQILEYKNRNSLIDSHFDPDQKTKVLIHGYTDNGWVDWIKHTRDAYLEQSDYNVISVDWSALAGPSPYYFYVCDNVIPVAYRSAAVLDFIIDTLGGAYEDYHVIGFSLGAQVAGNVGHALDGKLPRVTGLDPAGPLFHEQPEYAKLSKYSARLVDVIHAAGLWIGMDDPCGDIDFYPNKGTAHQPGCERESISLECSHPRAHEYFVESISEPRGFKALKCDSWDDYSDGKCSENKVNYMGNSVKSDSSGRFYLRTNRKPPYAIPNP